VRSTPNIVPRSDTGHRAPRTELVASTESSVSVVSTQMIRLLTAPNDSDRPGTTIMEPLYEKVELPIIMSEQPDRHTKCVRPKMALLHAQRPVSPLVPWFAFALPIFGA
jgi:hypothetical protein